MNLGGCSPQSHLKPLHTALCDGFVQGWLQDADLQDCVASTVIVALSAVMPIIQSSLGHHARMPPHPVDY